MFLSLLTFKVYKNNSLINNKNILAFRHICGRHPSFIKVKELQGKENTSVSLIVDI